MSVRVVPAMFGRYRNLHDGRRMTVVREWGNDLGVFTVRLADAYGFEWVGSVEDFYANWIHEDVWDGGERRAAQ